MRQLHRGCVSTATQDWPRLKHAVSSEHRDSRGHPAGRVLVHGDTKTDCSGNRSWFAAGNLT